MVLQRSLSNNNRDFTTVSVKEKFLNKGKIPLGSEIKGEFLIFNTGKSDLYIEKVNVSCTCTSTTQLNEPIQVGDSTIIIIEYEKLNPGYFFTDVLVQGNFLESPLILSFEGFLVESHLLQN